jgi:hypothetical protein
LVLSDEELDSYLFMFGEALAQKAITVFCSVKMLVQFFRKFSPNKDQCPARESGQCLAWLMARQYWIGVTVFVFITYLYLIALCTGGRVLMTSIDMNGLSLVKPESDNGGCI